MDRDFEMISKALKSYALHSLRHCARNRFHLGCVCIVLLRFLWPGGVFKYKLHIRPGILAEHCLVVCCCLVEAKVEVAVVCDHTTALLANSKSFHPETDLPCIPSHHCAMVQKAPSAHHMSL